VCIGQDLQWECLGHVQSRLAISYKAVGQDTYMGKIGQIVSIILAIAYRAVGQDPYMEEIGQINSITLAIAHAYVPPFYTYYVARTFIWRAQTL
jgi:hypothetical protein